MNRSLDSRYPATRWLFVLVCIAAAVPLAARGAPVFSAAERRSLTASRFAEARLLDALDADEHAQVLILLALPSARVATRGARWAERSGERAAIAGAADRVLAHLAGELELHHRYRSAPLLAGSISRAGLRRLFRHPDVARVALDTGGEPALLEAVPHIDLDLVRSVYTGEGVTVAVIDSGVAPGHPDLADDIVDERCFCRTEGGCCPGGATRASGPGSAADNHGHGTAVTGVITSAGNVAPLGGAPDAGIVAIRIMAPSGFDNLADPFAALDYVLNERPDVDLVNMSLGTSERLEGDCDEHVVGIAFGYFTDQLRAEGVLSFASAGNDGSGTAMTSPACVAGVISVGAVYESGPGGPGDEVAEWSNTSPTTDILAPGTSTDTTGLGGSEWTGFAGTSAASPLAVACAATLLQANPGLAPDLLEAALESSSTRIVDPKNGLDYPRVDCEEAHAWVRSACADAIDNDRDGASDLGDPGCPFPEAPLEDPVCDDGLDNDADGLVDFDDPLCSAAWPYWERAPSCGLGAEIALALALLLRRRG